MESHFFRVFSACALNLSMFIYNKLKLQINSSIGFLKLSPSVIYQFFLLCVLCFSALADAALYPQGNREVWTPPNKTFPLSVDALPIPEKPDLPPITKPVAGTYPYNGVRDLAVVKGKVYAEALPLYGGPYGLFGYGGHAQLFEFDSNNSGDLLHRDTIPEILWSGGTGSYPADARIAADSYGNVYIAGEWGSFTSKVESWLVKYGIGFFKTWSKSVSAQDVSANIARSGAIKDVAV